MELKSELVSQSMKDSPEVVLYMEVLTILVWAHWRRKIDAKHATVHILVVELK
jgi:hypothetical protein